MHRPLTLLLILLTTLTTVVAPWSLTAHALAAQSCHDAAELVEQTLDPTAAIVAPQSEFSASWTLRNSGDCTWSRSYRLIFVSGERMAGARSLRLPNQVEPGQSITLSLDLTAPSAAGHYEGAWQLRNQGGDTFGPPLTLAITVGQAGKDSDIELPAVLTIGGYGVFATAQEPLYGCVQDGALPTSPKLIVDDAGLAYRYATLYLCSLSAGEAVTVTITDPLGNTFSHSYVQGPDASIYDYVDASQSYTGTATAVNLNWPAAAPDGEWSISVSGATLTSDLTLVVPAPQIPVDTGEPYPQLDNIPSGPIDPVLDANVCHYAYAPGEALTLLGTELPPNTPLRLGFYATRFDVEYLVDQITVQSDAEGAFNIAASAQNEPGDYNLYLFEQVDPNAYLDDGTFDLTLSNDLASSCYRVKPAAETQLPLRLAYAQGLPGVSDIRVFDFTTGDSFYPSIRQGDCDTSNPSWWSDGEWVLYQSNCVRDLSDAYGMTTAGDQYDLYSSRVTNDYSLPDDERHTQLTNTAGANETEAAANSDGVIVYRKTLTTTALTDSGELWLYDLYDDSQWSLELSGSAPTWSPDGSRIAFMSDTEGNKEGNSAGENAGSWQVYVYNVDEETLTLVSVGCKSHCRNPAWSPDGKQILYEVTVSASDLTPAGLWIATAINDGDGSSKARPYLAGPYGNPTWSAAGWIFFEGPDGLYRAKPGRQAVAERFFYSNPASALIGAPQWSR